MGYAKIKFPCGYEEEQEDGDLWSYQLSRAIKENHKRICNCLLKKKEND